MLDDEGKAYKRPNYKENDKLISRPYALEVESVLFYGEDGIKDDFGTGQ